MSSSRDSQPNSSSAALRSEKRDLRLTHKARRDALQPSVKESYDRKITAHLRRYVQQLGGRPRIAAYSPLPSEPGGKRLVPVLSEIAELWLPVSGEAGILQWGRYTPGSSRIGAYGITEPEPPHSDSSILTSLDAVIIPAMAIDNAGYRLGKGAGYYDRALNAIKGHDVGLIGVVYSFELVPRVPAESHDLPVSAMITELGLVEPTGEEL